MVPVTKTFLPPLEKYNRILEKIWKNEWITNNGEILQELEQSIEKRYSTNPINLVANGTIGLQIAIEALGLKNEIITTPFSYVATVSSIVWQKCQPVFIDIDPDTLNINTELIEQAITDKTTGILVTHVFGNPCDVVKIEELAKKNDLKVIYDAAHCFGVELNNESIFNWGDISVTSFHATKTFHTVEGGALFSKDSSIHYKIGQLRNFGHKGYYDFDGIGINGKMSELHAAMGLLNLEYIDEIIASRRIISEKYDEVVISKKYKTPDFAVNSKRNYAYYPILFPNEKKLLNVVDKLNKKDIHPRRYFYPSLSKLDYVKKTNLHEAEGVTARVLCLPIYFNMSNEVFSSIAKCLLKD